MDYKIKHYSAHCEVEFGKYAGLTIQDIVQADPAYIRWCVVNLAHFYLTPKQDGLVEYLNLDEEENTILFAKGKLYKQQIAEKHSLGCGDGYGEHEYEDNYMFGDTCILCGYDRLRPDSSDYDEEVHETSSYDDDSDEIDRWNFDALSGGQFGDYDSFKENGGDVDDLRDYMGH